MWEITMIVDGQEKLLDNRTFDTEHDADNYAQGIGFERYKVSEVGSDKVQPIRISATTANTNPLGEVDKCWFCGKSEGEMVFDTEFDTTLHLSCLKKELQLDPENPEANIMKYLLEETEIN